MPHRVIHLHLQAPAKPAEGATCNGCGVCCSAEPCPLGQWLSRSRTGACAALDWDDGAVRYHCGVLATPSRWLPWLPAAAARALARRWIAAGAGCDSDFLAASPDASPPRVDGASAA